jgi:hypothetical protein
MKNDSTTRIGSVIDVYDSSLELDVQVFGFASLSAALPLS